MRTLPWHEETAGGCHCHMFRLGLAVASDRIYGGGCGFFTPSTLCFLPWRESFPPSVFAPFPPWLLPCCPYTGPNTPHMCGRAFGPLVSHLGSHEKNMLSAAGPVSFVSVLWLSSSWQESCHPFWSFTTHAAVTEWQRVTTHSDILLQKTVQLIHNCYRSFLFCIRHNAISYVWPKKKKISQKAAQEQRLA